MAIFLPTTYRSEAHTSLCPRAFVVCAFKRPGTQT
jgi:hypothetical protein